MELKKISYKSAVFFGFFALVSYFLIGLLQFGSLKLAAGNTAYAEALNALSSMSPLMLLVGVPVISGVVVYLLALLAIFIYNIVAKKYPISWEIKK